MSENIEKIKCLIIGSGPAGYTAAIYAARADMKPVMYTGLQMGGQLTTTTEVDNFPGYANGTDGTAMMEDLKNQAERFGTEVRFGMVTEVVLSSEVGGIHEIVVDGSKKLHANTVIISTGATAKYLGLESEQRLIGGGVSACATCDGFFYKGQDVIVVGAGDTAAEEATYLANICRKVTVLVRKDYMRASKAMQHRVNKTENIEVLFNTELDEVLGDNVVEGVRVVNNISGDKKEISVMGIFIAIGHKPNTGIFEGQIEINNGYIKVQAGLEGNATQTSVEGVFAAGDVADHVYRQAVTSAGSGCMAALDAEKFLDNS